MPDQPHTYGICQCQDPLPHIDFVLLQGWYPFLLHQYQLHHELIRVASKYPVIAKDYFYNKKHKTVEIIKQNGSVELAPIVGLSEVIVDIVETGTTLKENGLEVLEEICPLSARVVVNQVSMKMENERINKILAGFKTAIEKRK